MAQLTNKQAAVAAATTFPTPSALIAGRLLVDRSPFKAGLEIPALKVQRLRHIAGCGLAGGAPDHLYIYCETLADFDALIGCSPADQAKVAALYNDKTIT